MTVAELLDQLRDCNPDDEVRLATQPNWPLEYGVLPWLAQLGGVVYIGEGQQVGYLSGEARTAVWA